MNEEREYVLGTHDQELQRLGLQHRVWRSKMLEAWADAGITEGSRVADFGSGPGYASFDLSEIVGESGEVLGIEQSARFVAFAKTEAQRRGITNIRFLEADLNEGIPWNHNIDIVWCRWVASFVRDLSTLVEHVSAALRPGGRAIFHEYVDYSTWRTSPPSPSVETFVAKVMDSWRASGGEPDVALTLRPTLLMAGFEVLDTTPIVFAVGPADFIWRWPSAFLKAYSRRLAENGEVTESWATQLSQDFAAIERSSNSLMITPLLLQIVARKP
jgi:SAM-dependent methyltransferase